MSRFWRTWTIGWCWAVGLFGVILAASAFEATRGPTRLLFGLLNNRVAFDPDAHAQFSLAVLGAVTVGWSLTLLAAVQGAHQLGDQARSVWMLVTGSLVVWYVIDTALSLATGFGLNAIPNTIFLAAFLLPIICSGVLKAPSREGAASPGRAW
jgi:hypothetical protein